MDRINKMLFSLSCGVVTSILHFYIIPQFFMRGMYDILWGVLMILLPAIVAILLLHVFGKCLPKMIILSFLTECLIIIVFYKPIGIFLGYHLYSLNWDLFEFVAYFMFAFGFAVSTALIQFLALIILKKRKCS